MPEIVAFQANLRYNCYRSEKETLLCCLRPGEDGYEDDDQRIPCLEPKSPVYTRNERRRKKMESSVGEDPEPRVNMPHGVSGEAPSV